MSFEPLDFPFTPPPTVPSQATESTQPSPTGSTGGGATFGAQSNAGKLISQLTDLVSMSQYLQNAIVTRNNQVGITIDSAVDPDTSRALSAIYGTATPPAIITIPMYNALLDAHLGALQLEMALGNKSTVQANPIQVADLTTAVNAVSTHLVDSTSYSTWLPLQLASLKSDAIVFQNLATTLSSYPSFYSIATVPATYQAATLHLSNIDISPDLNQYQTGMMDRFAQSYSNVYLAMSTVHAVEQDIGAVMNQYFYQPLTNMLMIVSLFNALKGLSLKGAMGSLVADSINYSLTRLTAEASGMLYSCDQLVQMAIDPLRGTLGAMNGVISAAQQQAFILGTLATGGLAGMSKANACVASNPSNKTTKATKIISIPGADVVSEGIKQLGEMLNWASWKSQSSFQTIDKSMRQLLNRRLKQQNDMTQLMCSMRALDALLGVAVGVVGAFQKGTLTANSSPQQQQEAANSILHSLQTGSNTTFVTEGNQIIVNPPDMPAVTASVQRVLTSAKIRVPLGRIAS